jgi:hypothetical protein
MKQPKLFHDKMVVSITEKRLDGTEKIYTCRTTNASLLFSTLQGWEEEVEDPYKRTSSWVLMMQFILKMMNSYPNKQGYALSIGFNGKVIQPTVLPAGEYVNFNS